MKRLLLSLLVFLSLSCSQTGEMKSDVVQATPENVRSIEANKPRVAAEPKPPVKSGAEEVKDFNIRRIEGFSEQKNADGVDQPPFSRAILPDLYHDAPTRTDETVTVVPLKSAVARFDLKIVASTRIEQECDGSIVWKTEFEPITDKIITALKPMNLDSNPRDVTLLEAVVIYPAIGSAVLLSNKQITAAMLPKGVKPGALEAAVDADGDGKPDLILTADKSFKRVGNRWQLIKEFLDEDC